MKIPLIVALLVAMVFAGILLWLIVVPVLISLMRMM